MKKIAEVQSPAMEISPKSEFPGSDSHHMEKQPSWTHVMKWAMFFMQ